MSETKRIILGSGELFAQEYNGTIPQTTALCVSQNRLGFISGGATLTYTPSYYEAKDDLGFVKKPIMTEEVASLKAGVMTIDGETIKHLCETGRATMSEEGDLRTVKIGGVANATNKNYVLCFWHKDAKDGDIWVTIVGRNQTGFELAFAKDKETVINAEFKCEPMDDEGTLIEYVEQVLPVG